MNTLRIAFDRHIKKRGITQAAAANELGCKPETLNRVLNMKQRCGRIFAEKMESWSGGSVPFISCVRPALIGKVKNTKK